MAITRCHSHIKSRQYAKPTCHSYMHHALYCLYMITYQISSFLWHQHDKALQSKQSIRMKKQRRKGLNTVQTSLLPFREDRTYLLDARTNYNSSRCIQEGINISCSAMMGRQTFSSFRFSFPSWIANYDVRSVHSACGCITSLNSWLVGK